MSSNYYYLVADLPKISFDTDLKDAINIPLLKEEVRTHVPKSDYAYVDMLFARYDIANLLNLILKRGLPFSDKGAFTKEQLEAGLENPKFLPSYMAEVVETFVPKPPKVSEDGEEQEEEKIEEPVATEENGDEETDENRFPAPESDPEAFALQRFYAKALSSRNPFIRSWFGFDMDLRNILAAYSAKRLGVEKAGVLMGENKVVKALLESTASDFGLRHELEYLDGLLHGAEQADMMERERKIDTVRYDMADIISRNEYFNISCILGFLQKADIADRWIKFDKDMGMAMFKQILKDIQAAFDVRQALSEDAVLKKLSHNE